MISKTLVAIERLSSEPISLNPTKLVGTQHSFRIRVGDYRIVYNIFSKTLVIEIIRIRHRKDVYK